MPKISVQRDKVEGFKPVEAGVYEVRLDGFGPKTSKKGDSTNLQPKMVIVNHPTHNDQRLFDNLNSGAWYLQDFVHCFGLEMEDQGESVGIPGEFQGPDDDPSKWTYVGPLLGRVGKVRVLVTEGQNGRKQNAIDQFYFAVPACQEKHTTNLVR